MLFRKLALALAATAALGTASLAVSSTPAEAKKWGFHHHHHHHGHHTTGAPTGSTARLSSATAPTAVAT